MTTSACCSMTSRRVFSCFLVFGGILCNSVSTDICQNIVPYSKEHLSTFWKPVCWETDGIHLSKSLADWRLAEDQLNLNSLPIDTNRQNFVRQVRNALFSYVLPTPFKTKVKLASVWDHVLLKLLDLHVDVAHSQDFIQVSTAFT